MKQCYWCKTNYEKGVGKFCSRSCLGKNGASNRKLIKCELCNKEFRKENLKKHKISCIKKHEKKNCPECGNEFKGLKKYCSRSCSNKQGGKINAIKNIDLLKQNKYWGNCKGPAEPKEKQYCKKCGIECSGKTGYCKTCWSKSEENRKQQSINTKRAISEGRLDRWYKSKDGSYAEKWWQQYFNDNNIEYDWQRREGLFLIDFALEKNGQKIDFEVDGAQHENRKEHDIKRAEKLAQKGYITFRVKWYNKKKKEEIESEKQRFWSFWNSL